jgi:mono/diheme cytochrome c family protein
MAEWVSENVTAKKVTEEELDAVVEFLASLSELYNVEKLDANRITQGRKFFAQGSDAVGESCYDCHSMKVAYDPDGLFADESSHNATGAPDLTGYGSAAWLREFIGHPGSKKFYGSHNAMQEFAGSLTEREINLIVNWLLHDWPEPKSATEKASSSSD